MKGYLLIVLHAHLPFVRHPDHDRWLEEDWLFEAIIETYIPLLRSFENLERAGVPFRVTLSMSPTLTAMLEDEVLQQRFLRHLDRLIEFSRKEIKRTRWMPEYLPLAERYYKLYIETRRFFRDRLGCRLVPAFARHEEAGSLEIMTCGATHGFLPLMLGDRSLWRGQIHTAVRDHERVFGRKPKGMWLPECGYTEGVDEILAEAGIEYVYLDTHAILHAQPTPPYGVYTPVRMPSGPCAFGRDQQSSTQVWAAEVGYPGDPVYREFYRDVGYDLDYEYVKPYLHDDGHRTNLGVKYYRVTGDGDEKKPYDFANAKEKAARHAEDFLKRRAKQIQTLAPDMDRPPVIVAPYDAELFGHWWFEGPQFLEFLFMKAHFDQGDVELTTGSDYLAKSPEPPSAAPSLSSWGHNGYCEYWLDPSNDWMYPQLHRAGDELIAIAEAADSPATERSAAESAATDSPTTESSTIEGADGDGSGNRFTIVTPELRERIVRQLAREFLLAQGSDWAFILKTGTMTEYAKWRFEDHLENFGELRDSFWTGRVDLSRLEYLEGKHNIFPDIDVSVWRRDWPSRAVEAAQSLARPQNEASTSPSASSPSS